MLTVPFALERWFAAHEFSARRMLSSSDCEALSMDDVLAGADDDVLERWRSLRLGYTESRGLPALRAEVARDYAVPRGDSDDDSIGGDDVLCVVPEEGVLLALTALVEPGQRVIVTTPAYASLVEVVRHRGGVVVPWPARLTASGSFAFDVDELASLLKDGAAVVVVNVPHNPTGALPTAAEWSRIVALVDDAGGRLFSDEMYRHLELGSADGTTDGTTDGALTTLPSAVALSPRAIALSGLSKSLSAPGLRTGWLVTRDRALLQRLATMKDWTTICAAAPAELLALAILRRRRTIEADNRARIARNVAAVVAALAEFGADPALVDVEPGARRFTFHPPRAGSVALLTLEQEPSAEAFCQRVLDETGSLLVPATLFAGPSAAGDRDDRRVRLGLGRDDFADGFRALLRHLRAGAR